MSARESIAVYTAASGDRSESLLKRTCLVKLSGQTRALLSLGDYYNSKAVFAAYHLSSHVVRSTLALMLFAEHACLRHGFQ